MKLNPLEIVIGIVGTQAELVRRINAAVNHDPARILTPQAVSKWDFIPEGRALDVEAAVDGQVDARSILEYARECRHKAIEAA